MDYQPQQPDEGYSEAPLSGTASGSFAVKSAADESAGFPSRLNGELSSQLTRHIQSLSLASKIQLTESLLDGLPTSIIVQIVQKLNPRLYIDFIRYLPAEICLKILGYLDPLSLISAARSCRAWYGLALDRQLWERLYFLEGWKIVDAELKAWEEKMNRDKPVPSESGHAWKRRALSSSRRLDNDNDLDHVMLDADRTGSAPAAFAEASTSLFGSSVPAAASEPKSKGKGKGKDREPPVSSTPSAPSITTTPPATTDAVPEYTLPRSTMCLWDPATSRYRASWKYLYAMRRRLEANWENGQFTNFQFPHPNHPEEAHGEYIYTIQFNPEYLVSGSRDRTIRVWSMRTHRLVRPPLLGHRGSVLCLQFDSDPAEDLIVSGSSDSNVILWRFSSGQILQRLSRAHREPVLNVKFDKRILVTCSKDKTIKIFNRTPLRAGDPGYGDVVVQPVPIHLKDYGYDGLDQHPIKPPYTLIGSLEGHSAAVNAVQIYGHEVVSASGDRNVKIWDWPTQTCMRTFLGHSKGIACVQYDGRRIVSGSSDNEVKVFDRQSGVEVASLRGHSSLVRTVQAGFGDLPYSSYEDAREAAKVDQRYIEAVQNGTLQPSYHHQHHHRRRGDHGSHSTDNPGSQLPEDIRFTGAKLPPGGGGGGRYGRIVSGSYDTTIIIWRRDKEGIWKAQHRLRQEEAADAAAAVAQANNTPPTGPPTHDDNALYPTAPMQLPDPSHTLSEAALVALLDELTPQGVPAFQQALLLYPVLLSRPALVEDAINRHPSPFVRSQLRQALSAAQVRQQIAQVRARPGPAAPAASVPPPTPAAAAAQPAAAPAALAPGPLPPPFEGSQIPGAPAQAAQQPATAVPGAPPVLSDGMGQGATGTEAPAAAAAAAAVAPAPAPAPPAGAPRPAGHVHIPPEAGSAARVFKLQFDARRIVCCSQTSTIVGWDFCNGDAELEEVVRFFGTVE